MLFVFLLLIISSLFDSVKYTIFVHCWKVYNLFVRALETGRKASLW